ncbi:tRNA pseudouridine(13) synthase TruD [archaeon]|nr:MAG: tRNA pseudouridine(13) synthase TruD [archaeon]
MRFDAPEEERRIGIEVYVSDSDGIGGRIKASPKDFVIEEILEDGTILARDGKNLLSKFKDENGKYTLILVEKINIDTLIMIMKIADKLSIPRNMIRYAGLKDKRAIAVQLLCVPVPAHKISERIDRISKVKIKEIVPSNYEIKTGKLYGNRFTVTISNVSLEEQLIKDRIKSIIEEINVYGCPNFFGHQRFGTVRPITHTIGKYLIKGDLERAIKTYLAKYFPCEQERVIFARKLAAEGKFKDASKAFPRKLVYERFICKILDRHPGDYRRAFKVFPKSLQKLFVHAYQAYVFNRTLSEMMKKGMHPREIEGITLIGDDKPSQISEISMKILEEDGISFEDFRRLKSLFPYIRVRCRVRKACFIPEKFRLVEVKKADDTFSAKVSFILRKDMYATVLLREIMKPSNLLEAGF